MLFFSSFLLLPFLFLFFHCCLPYIPNPCIPKSILWWKVFTAVCFYWWVLLKYRNMLCSRHFVKHIFNRAHTWSYWMELETNIMNIWRWITCQWDHFMCHHIPNTLKIKYITTFIFISDSSGVYMNKYVNAHMGQTRRKCRKSLPLSLTSWE